MIRTITIPQDLHRKIKILSVKEGKSIQKFVEEILIKVVNQEKI